MRNFEGYKFISTYRYPLVIGFMLLDFLLKYLFKRPDLYFLQLKYFPTLKPKLFIASLFAEMTSLWNFYACLILSSLVFRGIPVGEGFIYSLGIIVLVYAWQIIASYLSALYTVDRSRSFLFLILTFCCAVRYLALVDTIGYPYRIALSISYIAIACLAIPFLAKRLVRMASEYIPKPIFWTVKGARKLNSNAILAYLSFALKMIWRAPLLRKQLFICLGITVLYGYLLKTNSRIYDSSIFRMIIYSFIFSLFPLIFGQYLISGESSFFEKLMLMPRFQRYIWSRFLLSILWSSLMFITMLFLVERPWWLEIFAIYIYAIGPITLASFGAMLFANRRINLFGKWTENAASAYSLQMVYIMLSFLLCLLPVVLIEIRISDKRIANIIIAAIGCVMLLFSYRIISFWTKQLFRRKYKKLQLFRK